MNRLILINMQKMRCATGIAGLISLLLLSQAPLATLHAEVPMHRVDLVLKGALLPTRTGYAKGPTEAFLMAYFVGDSVEENRLHLCWSRDGLKWTALNNDKPVVTSSMSTKAIRDPAILRKQDGAFVLMYTDAAWSVGQKPTCGFWDSPDLVNWTNQRICTLSGNPAVPAWGPEAIYDPASGKYIVLWSTSASDALWYNTTTDFNTFSPEARFFSPGHQVLENNIFQQGEYYYLIYKDERGNNSADTPYKALKVARSKSLTPGSFTTLTDDYISPHLSEGPVICKAINADRWYLYYDMFMEGGIFKCSTTTNLNGNTTDWSPLPDNQFSLPKRVRNGHILEIDREELIRLRDVWDNGPNFAGGCTAVASSAKDGNPASQANDLSYNTFWSAAAGKGANEWLEINLGTSRTFNKTILRQSNSDRITGYKIQYHNGMEWLDAYTGGSMGNKVKIDAFPPVTSSRVRLLVTKVQPGSAVAESETDTCPQINEFDIYLNPQKKFKGPVSAVAGDGVQQRWTKEKAWDWYNKQPWLVGCNFVPSTAVNAIEMWQAETFDPVTIERELGWAKQLGFNTVRVFHNFVVWKADADGLKKRFDQFLAIASKLGIRAMPVLFDDCNFAGGIPHPGKQPEPTPLVSNSQWVGSPPPAMVSDMNAWPELERYVKDMVTSFKNDPRIVIWDLYNEPSAVGSDLLLVESFRWARACSPVQPLTFGAWEGWNKYTDAIIAQSDVISFHCYASKDRVLGRIIDLKKHGRPVICSEWMSRPAGSRFDIDLPMFKNEQVGCYQWGLVNGRTQTHLVMHDPKEPVLWQHDILRRDGTPYNADETAIIKQLTGQLKVSSEKSSFRGWNSQRLGNGLVELQIVPEIGGRVIQLTMGNKDFLWVNPQLAGKLPPEGGVGPDNAWLNYGGDKLWPAPQGWDNAEQWPGPPDAVLDGGAYKMKVLSSGGGKASVLLTSGKDKRSGIQFSRVISVYDGSTRVSFETTMKNIDTKPRRWGIWAHTQLDGGKKGGGCNAEMNAYCPLNPKSHFTNGYTVIFGDEKNPSFQPAAAKNLMRVQYQYKVGKIGLDSQAGWVATVDGISGKVFVQRFVFEQGSEYPDGSSVEFWLNGLGSFKAWGKDNVMPADPVKNPYVFESEMLSPFAKLEPGESFTWKYDWYSTSIGAGKSEVVDCTSAGVVAEPFSAKVENGKIRLKGRFGVFAQGTLVVVMKDAQGKDVERNRIIEGVFPVIPVVLDHAVAMPAGTASVSLVLVDGAGTDTGKIAEAAVN